MATHVLNASDGEWWNLEQLRHLGSKVAWVSSDFRIWWKLKYLAEAFQPAEDIEQITTVSNGWRILLEGKWTSRKNFWQNNWEVVMSTWRILNRVLFIYSSTPMEKNYRSMSVELLVCCISFFIMERCVVFPTSSHQFWIVWRWWVLQSWNFPCFYENNLSSNIYKLLVEQTFHEVLWSVVSFKVWRIDSMLFYLRWSKSGLNWKLMNTFRQSFQLQWMLLLDSLISWCLHLGTTLAHKESPKPTLWCNS